MYVLDCCTMCTSRASFQLRRVSHCHPNMKSLTKGGERSCLFEIHAVKRSNSQYKGVASLVNMRRTISGEHLASWRQQG